MGVFSRAVNISVPKGWELYSAKITCSWIAREPDNPETEFEWKESREFIRYRKIASLNIVGVGGVPIHAFLEIHNDGSCHYHIEVHVTGEEYHIGPVKGWIRITEGPAPHRDAAVAMLEALLAFYVTQQERRDWSFFKKDGDLKSE